MKLKYISKIFLYTLLAVSILSCDKKLEIEPKQTIDSKTALSTPDDLEAAVVGCYSIMGGGALYGTNFFLLADLQAAEGYASWAGTFQGQRQVAQKTMNRNNAEASRTWIAAYRAINMANIVLDIVTDTDKKDQLEGEALFVRGIMHFELVRFYALPWGAVAGNTQPGVVIKTTPTLTEELGFEKIPRNTVSQVYSQVINDLTAAAQKLPEDNGTRADRFAALAFLSRVYLQQSDYVNARNAADEVIESGLYEMGPSVKAVFSNKNTTESIWEIQQNEQNNAGSSNDGMATFYSSLVGIGRADVRVNTGFRGLYDPIDRRSIEWYYDGVGARSGIFTSKWSSFSQNLPVIRIAEMYLTRAETNLRLGTNIGADPEEDLAQIRNPSRTNTNVIPVPDLNDILFERRLELAFEGVRIHDIKRLQGATGNYPWNDDKLVFPIPQREVDATQGILVQNPGY
jgi:hypothetical protein